MVLLLQRMVQIYWHCLRKNTILMITVIGLIIIQIITINAMTPMRH